MHPVGPGPLLTSSFSPTVRCTPRAHGTYAVTLRPNQPEARTSHRIGNKQCVHHSTASTVAYRPGWGSRSCSRVGPPMISTYKHHAAPFYSRRYVNASQSCRSSRPPRLAPPLHVPDPPLLPCRERDIATSLGKTNAGNGKELGVSKNTMCHIFCHIFCQGSELIDGALLDKGPHPIRKGHRKFITVF